MAKRRQAKLSPFHAAGRSAVLLLCLSRCSAFQSVRSSSRRSPLAFLPSASSRSAIVSTKIASANSAQSQDPGVPSPHASSHGPLRSALSDLPPTESPVTAPVSVKDPPFVFPKPPPAPTDEELRRDGLPILVRAAEHAAAGRVLLTELPDNGRGEVTYQTVLADAGRVADYLVGRLGKVDATVVNGEVPRQHANGAPQTVAHLTLPGSEYVASMWGTWASGRCSVPLATSQRVPELLHVLTDSRPDVILVGGGITRKIDGDDGAEVKTKAPHNVPELIQAAEEAGMSDRIVYLSDILGDPDGAAPGESTAETPYRLGRDGAIPSMDSPALVMYTSGTTGKPKGVLTTHRNNYHQITDLVWAWGWTPTDRALHLLPLHHVHGVINILSCAAYAGACCEFHPFHCQDTWWTLAGEKPPTSDSAGCALDENAATWTTNARPNVLMAVPTIYAKLLESAEVLPERVIRKAVDKTLRPMRLMVCGSAALPVSVLEKWRDLTGHTLLERYGMTEFAMALSNPYEPMDLRLPAHVGLPLPSVEVRIVDESGEIIPPGFDGKRCGELQVRGPLVFREYLNRPDVTLKEFADDGSGFFKTGDIAELDTESGTYRILGRASVDIIKNGGHKLSALEIERDLLEHPNIEELVVVGVKDPMWGERVGMICRMHRGCDPIDLPQLRDWADGRMAKYKVPSRILVVDMIPKNAMGKVNKKELKLLFAENRLAPFAP